jgi:hypothetical protein
MNENNSITTLLGGVDFEAAKLDGSTEAVRIRQLGIRHLPKYLEVFEDEAASIELFCDRPKGWADTLSLQSCNEILERGEALNLDPLTRYADRSLARREKVMPGFQEKLISRVVSTLPSSLQKSPPKPD